MDKWPLHTCQDDPLVELNELIEDNHPRRFVLWHVTSPQQREGRLTYLENFHPEIAITTEEDLPPWMILLCMDETFDRATHKAIVSSLKARLKVETPHLMGQAFGYETGAVEWYEEQLRRVL